ncbi:MAG: ABC transporter permease [Candidatus Promineifilaceae bacterium]|nr:ABC transporter permease [Candidatus Promineifilaceae bacterium]
MNLRENVRIALRALAANKLRAALTMLGIIIGVAAVISLLSVGRGVEQFVTGEFEGLGNNLLFVFPGQFEQGQGPPRPGASDLTNEDVEALRDPLRTPDLIAVTPELDRPAVVTRGNQEVQTIIAGTTANFPEVRNFYPLIGRFFTEQDDRSSARVAVLGQTVYEGLFPEGDLPLGQSIRINNTVFQVIGVMEEKGGSGFNDQDDLVLVPLGTAQRRLFPTRRVDGKFRVDVIYAQVVDESRQDAAIFQITETLRETHNVGFGDEDDFSVLSQSDLVETFGQITSVLTTFLAVIASISLLVGGIGIMNIMLVSVRERTREIGLRKAVGARQRDILWQFLVEAVILALIGGLIGLTIGAIAAQAIAGLSDSLQPTVAWDSVVLAVSFSAAVGLFFGIYPASRAARLRPIDALRYE